MFGDDGWNQNAQDEAVQLAELLGAPVFSSRGKPMPTFRPTIRCRAAGYPVEKEFSEVTGLQPDLLFMVGCRGLHGAAEEPSVMQIGPNPTLMGRHYPLDLAAQCNLKDTLPALCETISNMYDADTIELWRNQRAKVSTYAKRLLEREEAVVREHADDE